MSKVDYIVYGIGLFFMVLGFVWPKKWYGDIMKIVFSSLATGIFLAQLLYSLFS
jgi:hypothetical protein